MSPFTVELEEALDSDLIDVLELLESMNLDMDQVHTQQFYLATHNDEIVGLGRVLEHDDCAELCSLGIVESQRGLSIGSKLVKALIAKAERSPLYVVTDIPRYFERFGFQITEVYPLCIADKLQRCIESYDCESPVVLAI